MHVRRVLARPFSLTKGQDSEKKEEEGYGCEVSYKGAGYSLHPSQGVGKGASHVRAEKHAQSEGSDLPRVPQGASSHHERGQPHDGEEEEGVIFFAKCCGNITLGEECDCCPSCARWIRSSIVPFHIARRKVRLRLRVCAA